MHPLRLRLSPNVSRAARVTGVLVAGSLTIAAAWELTSGTWRAAAVGLVGCGFAAALAWAVWSSAGRWVEFDSEGVSFEAWGRRSARRQRVNFAAVVLWPAQLVCHTLGLDLRLSSADRSALGRWFDSGRFVAYGDPSGPMRHHLRTPPLPAAGECSPTAWVSDFSWRGVRPGRIPSMPWVVPEPQRSRAPGAVPLQKEVPTTQNLVALGRDLESTSGDPTAFRSGDRVPVWPVCCSQLAQHQSANPMRHELQLLCGEAEMDGLRHALVDPLLAGDDPAGRRAAQGLERDWTEALEAMREGVRPRGVDIFRCPSCRRIYAVVAP